MIPNLLSRNRLDSAVTAKMTLQRIQPGQDWRQLSTNFDNANFCRRAYPNVVAICPSNRFVATSPAYDPTSTFITIRFLKKWPRFFTRHV